MSEEAQEKPEVQKVEEVRETPAEVENADKQEHMIPKSRLDEVLAERAQLKAQLDEIEKARKKAEKEALEEQGEFERLYKEAIEEAQSYREEVTRMQIQAIKKDVANAAGFPSLWSRLSGSTEEEIKADMEALASSLPPAIAPNVSGGAGTGQRSKETVETMSEEEATWLANILRVPKEHLPRDIKI